MRLFLDRLGRKLEVSPALRVAAITIDLNSISSALTGSAAVFALAWGTTAHRVFTSLLFVCHGILLKCSDGFRA
jgi:hypothetical protein